MDIFDKIKQVAKIPGYLADHLPKDGTIVKVGVSLSPLYDENGLVTGVLAISQVIHR